MFEDLPCLRDEWQPVEDGRVRWTFRSSSPIKSTESIAETLEMVPDPGRRPSTRTSLARRQLNRRERHFSLLGQN